MPTFHELYVFIPVLTFSNVQQKYHSDGKRMIFKKIKRIILHGITILLFLIVQNQVSQILLKISTEKNGITDVLASVSVQYSAYILQHDDMI
jgi:hypothetical protein